MTTATNLTAALSSAATHAEASSVFESVRADESSLVCRAKEAPSPVDYRIELEGDRLWASWTTEDRYLSQSIEADLMWTKDDLADMIDEELVDLGWSGGQLGPMEHFRDQRMLYVFRQALPVEPGALGEHDGKRLAACVLAFDAVFRERGDMAPEED
ncbi:MAG: hypothetical protein AAGD00_07395 [Planctomycetota bacterium]